MPYLLLLTILPGSLGVLVFGYYALVDWQALQQAEGYFRQVSQPGADLATLFVAQARQDIHRINVFAEGVWVLLSAILAAIGLHGVCTITARKRK